MYKASCIFSCHFFFSEIINSFISLYYFSQTPVGLLASSQNVVNNNKKINIHAVYYADVSQEQISARCCLLQSHYIYSGALKSETKKEKKKKEREKKKPPI